MADNTINYGFPYPQGGDRVAVHTDVENLAKSVDAAALQTNLRIDTAESDIIDARFSKGSLYGGASLDSLETGVYWVSTGAAAESLGLPIVSQGPVYINNPGGSSTVSSAIFTSRSSRTFTNTKLSSGEWAGWTELARSAGTRTAALSLNHPRGMDSETGRNRQYRIPFKLGAKATLKRVAFRNYDYNSDTPGVGQVDLRGGGVGDHRMNPDGSMTGLFVEGSTVQRIASQQLAPADHGVFYGDDVNIELEPHKEYLLSYAYAADESMTVRRQLGRCFGSTQLGAWNNTGTTTATPQTFMGLHVWMELEVDKSTPVWTYVGDSQLAGLATTHPAYDSWAQTHAYNNGAIPQVLAHPGGSLQDFLDINKRALRKWDHLDKADRVYIAGLGSNDITNGRPLTGLQGYFATVAQNVREKFSPNLYLTTTLPRVAPSSADTVRAAYNEWLLTLPASAVAASDHFAAVLDPATGLTDTRWRGPGNDVHLNTAGNARLALSTDSLASAAAGAPTVTYVGDGVYEIS